MVFANNSRSAATTPERSPLLFCLTVLLLGGLTGCGFYNPPTSPDVVYSESSLESKSLQVPPDLTNVDNGEQFILPGQEPGSLSRNRLLPTFTSAKYVRRGGQNWLELERPAEAVWPLVLQFVREQKLLVESTEPTTGLILTQWRSDSGEADGGLLRNLISGDGQVFRYAFRLERNGEGTRVFARSMQIEADQIESAPAGWPASSHNPEQVSAVLSRLLVFLGADEQKARGILSNAQASALFDDAELQTTAAGSQILVHKGFNPTFNDVASALKALDYTIVQSDGSVGRIQFTAKAGDEPVLLSLTPVHVSAVRVQVTETGGARLDKSAELDLLDAIYKQLV